MDKKIISQLKEIVGSVNASDKLEDLCCYAYDATGENYMPDAVVRPDNTAEVSAVIKLADHYGVPVVPRGAGTGLSGGSVPIKGGIALVMSKMNRILEIDRENLIAVVQPGVVTEALQKEVEKDNLFYPPDPASLKMSTIGGNVAESAGGPRCLRYGVTRDYVLGLEVVLADGEIMRTGGRTLKNVSGYDLTRLLVGSEGTLGIITEIILKLLPKPANTCTVLLTFPEVEEAAKVVSQIIKSRILPITLEFMDETSLKAVEEYLQAGFPVEQAKALLLIEIEDLVAELDKIRKIAQNYKALEMQIAVDQAQKDKLWLARRSVAPAVAKLNPHKISEDIVVPRSKIPHIVKKIKTIGEELKLNIIIFGHAGDGNLHLHIPKNDNTEQAISRILTETIALGGTISGEHGIGMVKSKYLEQDIGSAALRVSKQIKSLFDPKGILNPGKIFY